jgi:hypothetical protein
MWRRVDLVWTDVSEVRIASIFRVEKSASEEPAWACGTSNGLRASKLEQTHYEFYFMELQIWTTKTYFK